jgi:hypothetical protein
VIDHIPRIYTSFAEFERDELRRLGLTPANPPAEPSPTPAEPTPLQTAPSIPPPVLVPMMTALPALPPAVSIVPAPSRSVISPSSLRAEGILEIGCVQGTSVLFVRTRVKLHLLHTTWLPDRRLDDYAVSLAVTWIEGHGLPSYEVADNLGVSDATLRNALVAAGYERLNPKQHAALAIARSARKIGNRRGRLVRTHAGEARA